MRTDLESDVFGRIITGSSCIMIAVGQVYTRAVFPEKISFLERSSSNPIRKNPLHGHLSVFLVVGINSLFIVYLGKNQWMHLHISSNACFFSVVDDTRVCVEKSCRKLSRSPLPTLFLTISCVRGWANTSHPDFLLLPLVVALFPSRYIILMVP